VITGWFIAARRCALRRAKPPQDESSACRLSSAGRTTPCSPWVFYGLLAWASLNAHTLSTEDTQEAALCRTQGEAAEVGETFTSFSES
jgi:hypothetical protein